MAEIRVTAKSRLVAELVEATVELVEEGNFSPTKSEIVTASAMRNLGEGASQVMRSLLEAEIANALEKYLPEVGEGSAKELGLQYHYTSQKFYKHRKKIPESLEEAKLYVVCFGNGRRGKAEGVRFVTREDEPDPLMAVATQKSVDTINAAITTQLSKIRAVIDSGVLGIERSEEIASRMPRVIAQASGGCSASAA